MILVDRKPWTLNSAACTVEDGQGLPGHSGLGQKAGPALGQ